MNNGPAATGKFFSELKERAAQQLPGESLGLFRSGKLKACIIPPYLSLSRALEAAKTLSFPVEIAAQNAHCEKSGAYTGEVSGQLLAELGLSWVLTGHSERRQFFGDTDETVRKRTESLLNQNFKVIACIGETRAERETGQTEQVLTRQLKGLFPEPRSGASTYLDGRLVLAYEPVWAIGTGLTATPEQAEEAHQCARIEISAQFYEPLLTATPEQAEEAHKIVRRFLSEHIDEGAAEKAQILYGGSVTPDNVATLLGCPNVDGALVGGASLKPESYLALLMAGVRAAAGR